MAVSPLSHEQTQALLAHLGHGRAPGMPAQAAPSHQTPLDWILDIASRPGRAVLGGLVAGEDAVGNSWEQSRKTGQALNPITSSIGAIGAALGGAAKGFTSTDPKDQINGAEAIRRVTTDVGKTVGNPDIRGEDVPDAVAGIGGFVTDVVSDPLTYIPGLDLIKAGKIVGGAVKGGENALKGVEAAKGVGRALLPAGDLLPGLKASAESEAKIAAQAAEKASRISAKIAEKNTQTSQVDEALAAASKNADEAVTPATTSSAVHNIANPDGQVVLGPEIAPASYLLQNHQAAQGVLSYLDTVGNQSAFATAANRLIKPVGKAADEVETKAPLRFLAPSKATWAKGLAGLARTAPEDEDVLERATLKVKDAAGKSKYVPLAVAMKTAKTDPRMGAAIDDAYTAWVKHAEEQHVFGNTVDEAGRVISAGPAATGNATTAVRDAAGTAAIDQAAKTTSTLDRVKALLASDEGKFWTEQHVGAALARNFAGFSDPAKFDEMVTRLRNIASGDDSVDHMSLLPAVDTPERNLLSATGIDPTVVNTARRAWKTMQSGDRTGVTPGVSDSPAYLAALKKEHGNAASKISAQFDSERAAVKGVEGLLNKDLKIDLSEYRFRSADGVAAKTVAAEGEGLAKRGTRIDTHLQYSLVKRIRDEVERTMEKRYGSRLDVQTARKQRATMELKAQKLAYDTLDGAGAPVAMTFRDASGAETMASLTKHEVYQQLAGSPEGKQLMDFLFFGKGSNVADTTFMQGIARLVRGDDLDDVMATITAGGKTSTGKDLPNWLNDGTPKVYAQIRPKVQSRGGFPDQPVWTSAARNGKNIDYIARPEDATAMLRGLLEGNRSALVALSQQHAADLLDKITDDIVTMTKAELSNLNSLLEGDNLAAFIVGLRDMPKTIAHMAYEGQAVPVSAEGAAAAVKVALPDQAFEEATRAERVAHAATLSKEEHRAAAEASYRAAAEAYSGEDAMIRESLTDTEGVLPDDIDLSTKWTSQTDQAYGEVARSFLAQFNPARRLFSATYALQGKVDAWRLTHDIGTLQGSLIKYTRDQANAASRQFGALADGQHTYLQLGFKAWQNGVEPTDEMTAGALKAIKGIMDGLAEGGKAPSATRLLNSRIFSTTSDYEYINRLMSRYSGTRGFVFDIERAEQEAIRAKVPLGEAVARQMSEWDVQDPADFFDGLNQATIKAVSDGAIAERFMAKANAGGWAHVGPKAPKNFVRVTATGESDLAPFLPKDLYLDPQVAFTLKRLDSVMRESTHLGDSPLSRLIKNVFDPALQAWKRAATVLHPGHHIRNDIGDLSMQYADAGVRYAAEGQKGAFQALYAGRHYDGVDTLAALESMGITVLDNGKKLTTGKYGAFSPDDLFRAAMERGLLADTRTIETLEDAGGSGLYKNALQAVTLQKGVAGRAVSGITEFRDHQAVLRHFIQKVYKANKDGFVDGINGRRLVPHNDFNAMFDAIADDVIKAHPNGTLLSKWERRNLTRIFPFYTWMRGALPFIINSSARYPGRALALPQAAYGAATAMGVHPQSLTDPFPADQENQFPSFIKDQITGPTFRGPDGSYFSISPGISQFDVPNTFLENGDPLGAIMGMANPLLKAPIELKTGADLATGATIHDKSDYIDGQIPLLQYLANFTGVSPTGTVVSELTRGTPDAQYQVAKGNKSAGLAQALGATNPNARGGSMTQNGEAGDQLMSLINALTGAGVVNDSKKSYRASAAYERKTANDPSGF